MQQCNDVEKFATAVPSCSVVFNKLVDVAKLARTFSLRVPILLSTAAIQSSFDLFVRSSWRD